jgi:hypothetical protein
LDGGARRLRPRWWCGKESAFAFVFVPTRVIPLFHLQIPNFEFPISLFGSSALAGLTFTLFTLSDVAKGGTKGSSDKTDCRAVCRVL